MVRKWIIWLIGINKTGKLYAEIISMRQIGWNKNGLNDFVLHFIECKHQTIQFYVNNFLRDFKTFLFVRCRIKSLQSEKNNPLILFKFSKIWFKFLNESCLF